MSPLISEMMDHSLPWHKLWKIRLHLGICKLCQCYQDQLRKLRQLGQYLGREDAQGLENHFLSQKQKDTIKLLLKNHR